MTMEQSADSRKSVSDLDNPPDSWEMAEVEERMKRLVPFSEPSCSTSGADVATSAFDQVDSVLLEAVQNPRLRMTILRMEQEVECFLRNPKLQLLEFQPMKSSYLRLAAHRVAQHYFLQSMVVDSNPLEGSRIVARKTSEIKYPSIRLADIPVESATEDKTFLSERVAIKQRQNREYNGENLKKNDVGLQWNSLKSMEERKEEYNKARARIFNGDDRAGKAGNGEAMYPVMQCKNSFVEFLKPKLGSTEEIQEAAGRSLALCEDRVHNEHRVPKEPEQKKLAQLQANKKVAILRDNDKDRKDPDYDRNPEKYVQHFDPGFGLSASAFGMQGIYNPIVNYNTEFPQLGGHPRRPMRPEQPPPCPAPQQMPWVAPVNSLAYRPLNSYVGQYTQAHGTPHTATAVYMRSHGPIAYHGPSIAYTFSHDHYQQLVYQQQSQPQQQKELQQCQQTDTGINQGWCQ